MKGLSGLLIGTFCLGYVAYCVLKSGTHVRGKGWVSREEGPTTFMFSVGLYAVLGVLSIGWFAYENFIR
ncbi:MAG: hypothetical protein CMA63_03730 [Euryarchaeota archaeon]|nr:hypothetical protein [Euryarchaeota archaeon]